jgi:aspartyl-tRNA(Asn)/glutamyl-tRNA(Gln) amidotransferase subunit B
MPAATLSPEVLAKYEPVIGLEVHVQLLTATKAFCGCANHFGSAPNSNVCPVCLALPGALPVLNEQAVEFATLAALAINCQVRERSIFARKNYFYPDLPKGYQISQFDRPLAEHGWIDVPTADGAPNEPGSPATGPRGWGGDGSSSLGCKRIGITRLHMEEDAGKSIHDGLVDSANHTSLDLNRCGTPLAEIVSDPDIRTPDEAFEYLVRLKEILLYCGVSDCNMEEGSLRCDANVSVRLKGAPQFGTKAEVKNLNSFRHVRAALEYEIERQIEVIESGGRVTQESRLWNAAEGRTYSMRSKEQAHDYRYFPEPDLPPLLISAEFLAETRKKLPELPEARRARMIADYELTTQDAFTLTATREFADRFEAAAKSAKNPHRVANLLLSELGGRLKTLGLEQEQSPVSMAGVVLAADLLDEGKISSKQLKQLFDLCFEKNEDFPAVYQREKPEQITDSAAIEALIDQVINANPKQVEQYRAGKTTVAGFFVGQVMKASKGQANPALLNELVTKKLEG